LNGVDGSAVTTSVVITSRTRLPVMGPPRSTALPLDGLGWLSPVRMSAAVLSIPSLAA
jgi:hypothetical protein